MSEDYPELIHCWFSEKQSLEQRNADFMWFKMDDGSVRKVSETNVERHGDASFLRNFEDSKYVGFGYYSHMGPNSQSK